MQFLLVPLCAIVLNAGLHTSLPNSSSLSVDERGLVRDLWRKGIYTAINERFVFFARSTWPHRTGLSAKVTFDVDHNGTISNVVLEKRSSDELFNELACQSVKSISAEKFARLPDTISSPVVRDQFTFEWNGRERFIYAGPHDDVVEYIEQRNERARQP